MIDNEQKIEEYLSELTDYIARELHLSTMAAVGAVCTSQVANDLTARKISQSTTIEELKRRLLREVTMPA